jgi:hypothetical protein
VVVLRLIDFAAIAALLIRFRSVLRPLAVRPLVMLGQASLQVFCVHLLCCIFGLTLLGSASMMSGAMQCALLATTLSVMLGTARIFSRSERVNGEATLAASPARQQAATHTIAA